MYVTTPKELAPEEDQGILFNLVKTPQYANLDYLEQATGHALRGVRQRCPRRSTSSPSTAWAATCTRLSSASSCSSRGRSASARRQQILQDLQPKWTASPARVSPSRRRRCRARPAARRCSSSSRTTADYQQLAQVLDEHAEGGAAQSGLFIFTDSDLKFDTPQIEVKIDHDKANRLGITMQDIGASLATLLGGNYVNRFNLYGRSYQVIPQVPRDFRLTPDWLTRYQVRTTTPARLVPLSTRRHRRADGAAERADELPAAQLGDAAGRAVPRPHGRRGRSTS